MRTLFAPLAALALSTAFLGFATPANAGIVESCGIDISAGSQCEMRVEGGCTASCTPVNFTAQCSADLYVGCNGMCTASVDVSCTTSCSASCEAQCQVEPAKFDCAASCQADCGASCDSRCAGAADGARCRASCDSTCSGECDARCKATPPSADCKAKCDASCSGSCEADANMQCQIDCQAKSFVSCETDLQGGCVTECSKPEGALFCDGQYVDVGDKLDQCVADLKSLFQIEVKGYATGNAQCSNGECTAEGKAGFSCAQSPGAGGANSSTGALGILGALAAFGLAIGRRKNERV